MVVGSCFEKVAVLIKSLQKLHFDLFHLTHNKAWNCRNIIDRELSILFVVKTHPKYCQNNKLIISNNVSMKMHLEYVRDRVKKLSNHNRVLSATPIRDAIMFLHLHKIARVCYLVTILRQTNWNIGNHLCCIEENADWI